MNRTPARRLLAVLFALQLGCVGTAPALAQQPPERPLVLVVPYGPGGGVDFVARVFAGRFESRFGRKVLVDNRPGAGGYTGSAYVARAAPDGETLLVNFTSSIVVNMVGSTEPAVDLIRTLTPVAVLAISEQYLWASGTINVKTVPELIAYAKRNPGKLNFAAVTNSLDEALYIPQFLNAAGIEAARIPYNGMADLVRALLSGEAHLLWASLAVGRPHLQSGKLVALGARGAERSEQLPGTPTIREQGVNFAGAPFDYSAFGPPGMSPELLGRLNRQLYASMENSPALSETLLKAGVSTAKPESPAALAAEFARQAKEIREGVLRFAKKP